MRVINLSRSASRNSATAQLDRQCESNRRFLRTVTSEPLDIQNLRWIGSHPSRRELRELRRLLMGGEFDALIVDDLTRLGRRNVGEIYRTCLNCGVRFISVQNRIDSDVVDGRNRAALAVAALDLVSSLPSRRVTR